MTILEIDGIGRVEVGPEFSRLPSDQQASAVDQIIAQIKGVDTAKPTVPGAIAEAPPPTVPPEPGLGAAAGRVASRAGEVAADRFGDRPFGLSENTLKELVSMGAIAGAGKFPTPIQLLNQIVYQFGAQAGDAVLRTIGAGVGALQGAAEQVAVEAGASPGMAKRLARDVGGLTEAAGVVAGSPAAGTQQAAARSVAATQRAAGREAAASRAAPAAVATEDFKVAARGFYKEAEDAGVVLSPKSYKAMSDDVLSTAARAGLDTTLTPDSVAAVKRIQELADPKTGPVSFQSLDLARQIASDAQGATKASDRRVAKIIVEKLDDYIAGLGTKDVVAGDAKAAATTIAQARDLWSRAAKLETVETLVRRAADSAAGFSGSGFENALRTEFRQLAKNDRKMRTFTAEEQAAIRQVARGTAGTNVARNVGKLAPTGGLSMILSPGAGAGIGTAVFGPGVIPAAIGAAGLAGIGGIGRKVATVLTQRSIRRLEDVIRNGDSALAQSAIRRGNALIASLAGAPAAAGAQQ